LRICNVFLVQAPGANVFKFLLLITDSCINGLECLSLGSFYRLVECLQGKRPMLRAQHLWGSTFRYVPTYLFDEAEKAFSDADQAYSE
jgi:hypothetical protein